MANAYLSPTQKLAVLQTDTYTNEKLMEGVKIWLAPCTEEKASWHLLWPMVLSFFASLSVSRLQSLSTYQMSEPDCLAKQSTEIDVRPM